MKAQNYQTVKGLIDDPKNRRPDGSMTDAAYAAYNSANAAHFDGFIPDDELAHAEAAPVQAGSVRISNKSCPICHAGGMLQFEDGTFRCQVTACNGKLPAKGGAA